MLLANIFASNELHGLARITAKPQDEVTVEPELVAKYIADGWLTIRKGVKKTKLGRQKLLHNLFPDRVWTLMYKMGFSTLSGRGGAKLTCKTPDGGVSNQIDVVAADDDIALYIECRTAKVPRKVPQFAENVAHLDGLRQCFTKAIRQSLGPRKVGALYWSYQHILSDNDAQRALDKNVKIFTERDLNYYEELAKQVGVASRYQFLADVFGSSKVDSLVTKVSAVRVRIGDTRCFAFAISPSKLLKIAYVSHRAKGSPTDVDTYQRLIRKARIKDIREYINNGGYFPTNIVLNFKSRRPLQFDKAAVPSNVDISSGEVGWLSLPSEYKSAWIIDGQHRLYAYSGANDANSSDLSVLAFENLDESDQARLFIDINAKQKSVKQNLLVELFAELHWNSADPKDRVTAIIAKLILSLDSNAQSPFFNKIVRADDPASSNRSISIKTLSNVLTAPELFLALSKAGEIPGAFWQTDQMMTLKRAATVLNFWFDTITSSQRDNWNLGRAPGGALGMNDSVVANVIVLRSIIRHIETSGVKLWNLNDAELIELLNPWAILMKAIFGSFNSQQIIDFRSLRGIQGQTQRYRELQIKLRDEQPGFNPQGLDDYIKSRDQNAINEARMLVDTIETKVQHHVVTTLKSVYGEEETGWWFQGVPKAIRARIVNQLNEEAIVVPKESRFNFIDYRMIAHDQWQLFKGTLGQDKSNVSKDKRTLWMSKVNDIRNRVSHASKGASASPADVAFLGEQLEWLTSSLNSGGQSEEMESE